MPSECELCGRALTVAAGEPVVCSDCERETDILGSAIREPAGICERCGLYWPLKSLTRQYGERVCPFCFDRRAGNYD